MSGRTIVIRYITVCALGGDKDLLVQCIGKLSQGIPEVDVGVVFDQNPKYFEASMPGRVIMK